MGACSVKMCLHNFSLTRIFCFKITKYTHIRDFPLLETSLFVLMSYATFLAAEAAELTGEYALISLILVFIVNVLCFQCFLAALFRHATFLSLPGLPTLARVTVLRLLCFWGRMYRCSCVTKISGLSK